MRTGRTMSAQEILVANGTIGGGVGGAGRARRGHSVPGCSRVLIVYLYTLDAPSFVA
jgi:hypothetical protein